MLGREAVVKFMKLRGMSAQVMSEKLGYSTRSGLTSRLYNKQDMRADTLARFLEALDCEIVVKSKLSDKTMFVINGKEDDEE